MKIALWLSLLIVFYAFVGYGILLLLLVKLKRLIKGKKLLTDVSDDTLPSCTLIVAVYNEQSIIKEKIQNSLALKYPPGK